MTGPIRQQLSAYVRGDVAVVSLHGELDSLGACILRAHLSEIRRQAWARCVADLVGLAFIDSVCLGLLVRNCTQIRRQGGTFALAGPQVAVHRILSVTGLLSWFEVHDTVEEAIAGAAGRQPAGPEAAPALGTLMTALPGAHQQDASAQERPRAALPPPGR